MHVPSEYRARYNKVRKSSGKAFADAWLQRLLNGERAGRGRGRVALSGNSFRRPRTRIAWSTCVRQYAELLADPFRLLDCWCLPVPPTFPNERLSVFCKGGTATGTAGTGFVAMNPYAMVNGDNAFASAPVFASDATWTGTGIAIPSGTSPGSNGVVGYPSNSPYTGADIGPTSDDIQYRLVAAGIRILYSGTELDRGGTIYGLCRPVDDSNNTLVGAYTSTLRKYDYVSAHSPKSNVWEELIHVPSAGNSFSDKYIDTATYGAPNMAIMFTSSTPITYVWEAYAHFEVIGTPARGKISAEEDIEGTRAVQAGFQNTGYTLKDGMNRLQEAMEYAESFVKQGTHVASTASRIASHLEL